jgi:hypothetical protein
MINSVPGGIIHQLHWKVNILYPEVQSEAMVDGCRVYALRAGGLLVNSRLSGTFVAVYQ